MPSARGPKYPARLAGRTWARGEAHGGVRTRASLYLSLFPADTCAVQAGRPHRVSWRRLPCTTSPPPPGAAAAVDKKPPPTHRARYLERIGEELRHWAARAQGRPCTKSAARARGASTPTALYAMCGCKHARQWTAEGPGVRSGSRKPLRPTPLLLPTEMSQLLRLPLQRWSIPRVSVCGGNATRAFSAPREQGATRVFVGNIPYAYTEREIADALTGAFVVCAMASWSAARGARRLTRRPVRQPMGWTKLSTCASPTTGRGTASRGTDGCNSSLPRRPGGPCASAR